MKILIFGVDFKCENYSVKYVTDEDEFFDEIIFRHYDVIILDFNLLSSFLEVYKNFKGAVVFVSGFVDELIYKKALEVGDFFYTYNEIWKISYRLKYIAKKLLKRDVFVFKDLVFNLKTKMLYKQRVPVKLSPAEREILEMLINNKNRFISKRYILENSENIDNISSVKVIISNLRKLGFDIENQKNLGYKIKENK